VGLKPRWAARDGYEAVVKLLLERGAELELKDEETRRRYCGLVHVGTRLSLSYCEKSNRTKTEIIIKLVPADQQALLHVLNS
jgi:hypothetical protein